MDTSGHLVTICQAKTTLARRRPPARCIQLQPTTACGSHENLNRQPMSSCRLPGLDAFNVVRQQRCLTTFRTSPDFILCDYLVFSTRTAGSRLARKTPHTRAINSDHVPSTSTERTVRIAAVSCWPKIGEHELCVGRGERGR